MAYRLVIADDEAYIRESLSTLIDWRRLGFEVAAAFEDGREVIDYLKSHAADVVLTDVCMYETDGIAVMKYVSERKPDTVVVLLSGYREFEYVKEALKLRAFDYLLKPIDIAELNDVFTRIRALLEGRPARDGDAQKFDAIESGDIRKALAYIDAHMSERITLQTVADAIHFSAGYLSRIFKAVVGENFIDYLIRVRMERAIELLRGGATPIREVAEAVGYTDIKYFYKAFKKHNGMTLRAWQAGKTHPGPFRHA